MAQVPRPHLVEAITQKLARQVAAATRVAQRQVERCAGRGTGAAAAAAFAACDGAVSEICKFLATLHAAANGPDEPERWPCFADALAQHLSEATDAGPEANGWCSKPVHRGHR